MTARHCLITGGSLGIGRATALMAASRGYDVSIAGLPKDAQAAQKVVREIESAGGRAVSINADVSAQADVAALFEEAERALGPLTALVNSAGMLYPSCVADFEADRLQRIFMVNVVGSMLCCREATRRMSTASGGAGGAIVNVSSMAATVGGRPGSVAYAATKAAIDCFTTGFAREVAGQGIRVNAVRPGMTVTPMTTWLQEAPDVRKRVEESVPMGRMGRPEEIAETILWLLSDAASFVTGAHVNAGGGGFQVAASR